MNKAEELVESYAQIKRKSYLGLYALGILGITAVVSSLNPPSDPSQLLQLTNDVVSFPVNAGHLAVDFLHSLVDKPWQQVMDQYINNPVLAQYLCTHVSILQSLNLSDAFHGADGFDLNRLTLENVKAVAGLVLHAGLIKKTLNRATRNAEKRVIREWGEQESQNTDENVGEEPEDEELSTIDMLSKRVKKLESKMRKVNKRLSTVEKWKKRTSSFFGGLIQDDETKNVGK